jgi:hypothetical protein
MNFHAQPGDTSSSPLTRRRRIRVALLLAAVVLLSAVLILAVQAMRSEKLVWLTPAEFARTSRPGPLTSVKNELKHLTRPLWRQFRKSKPCFTIGSELLIFPSTRRDNLGLGASVRTSGSGLRAWILSPTELTNFQARIKSMPKAEVAGQTRTITGSGMRTRMFMSNSPGLAMFASAVTVDVVPKVTASSIQLLVGVTSVQGIPAQQMSAITNFSAAFRALVPNNGGLIITDSDSKDPDGKTYFLIMTPSAVDPRGNPIKL